jgi:4-hydroxy-tetrahydrodipicolinate reductase
MGRRIATLASQSEDIVIVGAIEDPSHESIGKGLIELGPGGSEAEVWSASELAEVVRCTKPDVIVDFTTPDASTVNVSKAAEMGLSIVMGTTGHSREQMEAITEAVRTNGVAAVISPNMSAGVTVLLEACKLVSRMVPGFDVEILEIHHNQKLDAPSGTALQLARGVAEALGRQPEDSIRSGRAGKARREQGEIGIASLRGGDVVGDHTVIFAGVGERIELTHRAQSRDALASGAIAAIRFVAGAQSGVYSTRDVLSGGTG